MRIQNLYEVSPSEKNRIRRLHESVNPLLAEATQQSPGQSMDPCSTFVSTMSPSAAGLWTPGTIAPGGSSFGDIDCCLMFNGNFVGPYGDSSTPNMLQSHCDVAWNATSGVAPVSSGWHKCCKKSGTPNTVGTSYAKKADGISFGKPASGFEPVDRQEDLEEVRYMNELYDITLGHEDVPNPLESYGKIILESDTKGRDCGGRNQCSCKDLSALKKKVSTSKGSIGEAITHGGCCFCGEYGAYMPCPCRAPKGSPKLNERQYKMPDIDGLPDDYYPDFDNPFDGMSSGGGGGKYNTPENMKACKAAGGNQSLCARHLKAGTMPPKPSGTPQGKWVLGGFFCCALDLACCEGSPIDKIRDVFTEDTVYELPKRFGNKRLTESQLMDMVNSIVKEY